MEIEKMAGDPAPRRDTREAVMVVRARQYQTPDPADERVIHTDSATLDLDNVRRFRGADIGVFRGHSIEVRFAVNAQKETKDFVPNDFREFMRVDMTVKARVLVPGGPQPDYVEVVNNSWVYTTAPYIVMSREVGPLLPNLHVEFSLQIQL
ncbi:MAG: hypothetical protein K5872_06575 [Rhizobiaceae bacterium]|nr:hypothetical protein [Rhizobiaceae bacterium]MCV0405877.1 hypothetical protein [Rhizobiaceae bacterium]